LFIGFLMGLSCDANVTRDFLMISLPDNLYLGKGRTRECFLDPRDPSKCIKVDFSSKGYHQTAKEARYYQKLLKIKPALEYDFIPHFHGMEETDRGLGGVFDLIRDEDTDEVSLTLGHYLRDGTVALEQKLWSTALTEFLGRLMATGVIVRDLNPGNLCARKRSDGTIQLVAIDGIGHRDFIPLCDYFLRFARRKLQRYIDKKGMNSIPVLLDYSRKMDRKREAQLASLARISS
jgi:hypothetical protein